MKNMSIKKINIFWLRGMRELFGKKRPEKLSLCDIPPFIFLFQKWWGTLRSYLAEYPLHQAFFVRYNVPPFFRGCDLLPS
jgi:hypothetical protein